MTSIRRLRRRELAWRRYARKTCWNPRVSRPWWMGPATAVTPGHTRAWDRLQAELARRQVRAVYWPAYWPAEPAEPGCTLLPWPASSTCYCTGRPGCQPRRAAADACESCGDPACSGDCWGEEDDVEWPPDVTTIVPTGGVL